MDDFINWVKQSPQYPTLIFIHGERLFIRENDVFKVLAVQLAYEAYTKWPVFLVRKDVSGSNSNSTMQSNLGNDSSTETVNQLLQAMTAQNQVISSMMQVMASQNQQLISIVDQNSQLINQVQSLVDLLTEQEQEPDKETKFMDD